jgi:hypothetical protein
LPTGVVGERNNVRETVDRDVWRAAEFSELDKSQIGLEQLYSKNEDSARRKTQQLHNQ